jgi:hypothetical protein
VKKEECESGEWKEERAKEKRAEETFLVMKHQLFVKMS